MTQLKKRILTATILIPTFLFLLFYLSSIQFLIFTGLITLVGAWEWTNLLGIEKLIWRYIYLVLILYIMVSMLFIYTSIVFWASLINWSLAIILISRYPTENTMSDRVFWRGVTGIFVLIPCWMAINFLHHQANGIYILLSLFILIWGADTSAYFVGKKWGVIKLAPAVSPGKTWVGCGGAIVFAFLWTVLIIFIEPTLQRKGLSILVLAVITVIFSLVGDLF